MFFSIRESLYRCGFIPGEHQKPGPALDSQNVGLVRGNEGSKRPSAGWFEIRPQLEHFIGGGNPPGNALAFDAGQVLPHPQPEQTIFDELLAGETAQSLLIHALGPNHHFVGDGLSIGPAIRLSLGQDMPGGNQQSAVERQLAVIGAGEAVAFGVVGKFLRSV